MRALPWAGPRALLLAAPLAGLWDLLAAWWAAQWAASWAVLWAAQWVAWWAYPWAAERAGAMALLRAGRWVDQ